MNSDGGDLRGKLRPILLIGSAALLASFIAASAGSLKALHDLYAQEESIHGAWARQSESFYLVFSATQAFSESVLHHMLRSPADRTGGEGPEVERHAAQLSSALQKYAAGAPPAERQAVATIARQVEAEHELVRAALALAPAARNRGDLLILMGRLVPLRIQILVSSDHLYLSNRARLADATQLALAKFADLQGKLKRLLAFAFGAGLLLIVACAAYIARLEQHARDRFRELAQNREELQRLSARLVDVQESERLSIARELHDEVGQSLGALLVGLGHLESRVPPELTDVRSELHHMKSVAEQTVRTVRNMALLLRPSMLDDLGLAAALDWQGREVSRLGNMEVEVYADDVPEDLHADVKLCIYRLVQEALNNAARHADARNAHVRVEHVEDSVVVSVRDDGRGFDPSRSRGMGILGMEERVRNLGGRLFIDSRPGAGTLVRAELPLVPVRSVA
jgi:signal transduction histidine kinase